jgi:hypothetical protein
VFTAQHQRRLAGEQNFADHFSDTHRHRLGVARDRLHFVGGVDADFADLALQLYIEQLHVHRGVDDGSWPFARAAAPRRGGVIRHRNNHELRGFPRGKLGINRAEIARRPEIVG